MLIILKQQEMSLLSYLYLKLSARQWWVFVFIGSADTLYLEKGAKRCHECMRSGEYFTISKCMMVWQATGFHFKIYAFILEKECKMVAERRGLLLSNSCRWVGLWLFVVQKHSAAGYMLYYCADSFQFFVLLCRSSLN